MRRFKWLLVLALQAASALIVSYLAARLLWLSAGCYEVGMWALLPALGAVSGYLATVNGLSNYAAWLSPPAMGVLGHYLATFYLPGTPGPAFLCALLAIIGAATGETVLRRRGKNGGRRDGNR